MEKIAALKEQAPTQLQAKGGNEASPPVFQLQSGPATTAATTPKQDALNKLNTFAADSKSGQAFKNISKTAFVTALRSRINNPGGVDQKSLNACGPAAAAYLIAQDNIVQFTNFAIDLYSTGEANLGSMNVNPWDGLLSRAPGDADWGNGGINNVADYVIMASMRSDKNYFFDQFEDPGDQFSGITMPGTIKEWLAASGTYTDVKDDTSLTGESFNHFKSTLVPKHNGGHKVVMLIGADMITISRGNGTSKKGIKKDQLKDGKLGKKGQTSTPNHYVVFEGNFSVSGDDVTFDIWTWGSTETITISKTDFGRLYYGGVYAK